MSPAQRQDFQTTTRIVVPQRRLHHRSTNNINNRPRHCCHAEEPATTTVEGGTIPGTSSKSCGDRSVWATTEDRENDTDQHRPRPRIVYYSTSSTRRPQGTLLFLNEGPSRSFERNQPREDGLVDQSSPSEMKHTNGATRTMGREGGYRSIYPTLEHPASATIYTFQRMRIDPPCTTKHQNY